MSRGPGRLQREILDVLKAEPLTPFSVGMLVSRTTTVYGPGSLRADRKNRPFVFDESGELVTVRDDYRKVSRAALGLYRMGLLDRIWLVTHETETGYSSNGGGAWFYVLAGTDWEAVQAAVRAKR